MKNRIIFTRLGSSVFIGLGLLACPQYSFAVDFTATGNDPVACNNSLSAAVLTWCKKEWKCTEGLVAASTIPANTPYDPKTKSCSVSTGTGPAFAHCDCLPPDEETEL